MSLINRLTKRTTRLFLVICFVFTLLISGIEANVSPFDPSTISLTMIQKTPTIFLLTSSNEPRPQQKANALFQFHQAAQKYYSQYPNKSPEHTQIAKERLLFVVSDPNDGLYTFDRLSEFLGIRLEETPAVVYLSHHHVKYRYAEAQEINSQGVLEFLKAIEQGTVSIFYKSEPDTIPEPKAHKNNNKSYVRKLVGKSYNKLVAGSQKQQFVLFYSPLCYKSRVMKLQFEKAAESIKNNPNIIFSKIDATKNQVPIPVSPPQTQIISQKETPIIKFYGKDKSKPPITYSLLHEYEKSYDYMLKWLKENSGYKWVRSVEVNDNFIEEL